MRARRSRCKANEVVEARDMEKQLFLHNSDEEAGEAEVVKGFFACYLLCSLSPRHRGHTYIGFTVNPQRRIKQHNGEKRCGAWRTKRGRPWEMVMCIYGFPSNVSALQFEWAWQHPTESLAVRKAASSFKSLSGITNKIKLAYTMLTLSCWENLKLTVNFFSTKYTKYIAGCPRLPNQMRLDICGMEDLHCYVEGQAFQSSQADEEEDDGETNIDLELGCSVFSEEHHWSSSHGSKILMEMTEFETMRASASLTPSSPGEDAGMGKAEMSTNQSTPRSSENEEVTLSPEINVINLCTPSSGIIRSKTKRALFDSDIVDLTYSPVVIQL
ncbi:hypothetical protein KSP39_PZI001172 [Platanthera zijinensis]|uniref:Structure-specific endonuclease subunit SLX1 homolog n=1 Tax=Platanthera zijinensis TaxID=2320716 RepID=A0AAP0GGI1_9ASPA